MATARVKKIVRKLPGSGKKAPVVTYKGATETTDPVEKKELEAKGYTVVTIVPQPQLNGIIKYGLVPPGTKL